jgi:hypothetical protein
MMLKKYFLLAFLIMGYFASYAQYDDAYPHPRPKNCDTENSCPRNALFLETTIRMDKLGLNWASLNWDHNLVCRERYLMSFRLGVDFMSFSKLSSLGVPLGINLMIGGGGLMAEVGLGLNYLHISQNYDEATRKKFADNLSYLAATGMLGVRFQKKSNIFIRAGYTPMYSISGNDEIAITTKKGVAVVRDRPFYSMFSIGVGYTL